MKTGIALIILAGVTFCTASKLSCPEDVPKNVNFLQWGDHCYLFDIANFGDWNHADQQCTLKGGYLVDIHSQDEQDFIFRNWVKFRFVSPVDIEFWIGLTDGQNYSQEGNWTWISNEKQLDYQNWKTGQPSSQEELEDCALMEWSDSGKWHDYPCNQDKELIHHGWICKFRS